MGLSLSVANNGQTRHVLLIGAYAVKIPRINRSWRTFIRGLSASLQESEVFKYVGKWHPESVDLLCPILHQWLGGFITIMPRATPVTHYHEMVKQNIFKRIEAARLDGDDIEDNYGYLGDRIVKLDYGHCFNVFD